MCARRLTLVFEYVEHDLKKLLDLHPGGLALGLTKWFLVQLLRGVASARADLRCRWRRSVVDWESLIPFKILIGVIVEHCKKSTTGAGECGTTR